MKYIPFKHGICQGLIVLLFTALFSHVTANTIPWETGESRGEDLLIQLVTFGPGDVITTYFGHTALVVHDKRLDIARLITHTYAFEDALTAYEHLARRDTDALMVLLEYA